MLQTEKFDILFYKNEEEILKNSFDNQIYLNNKYEFNILKYNTILDLEKKYFSRENEEYLFNLDIANETCTIHLKKENMTFNIDVDYCILNEKEDEITLEYMIETDDTKNKIIIKKKG
jgi:hypothetical protein